MPLYRIKVKVLSGTDRPKVVGRYYRDLKLKNTSGAKARVRALLRIGQCQFRHGDTRVEIPTGAWKLDKKGKPYKKIKTEA